MAAFLLKGIIANYVSIFKPDDANGRASRKGILVMNDF